MNRLTRHRFGQRTTQVPAHIQDFVQEKINEHVRSSHSSGSSLEGSGLFEAIDGKMYLKETIKEHEKAGFQSCWPGSGSRCSGCGHDLSWAK